MKRLLATLEALGYIRTSKTEHHSLNDMEYGVVQLPNGNQEVILGNGQFGYVGFGCIFYFDPKGKYLGHGAIE